MPIDVDFTLALNERTGKLFLGKDVISALGPRVSSVRYGRIKHMPSNGFLRRVAGRITHEETKARVFRPALVGPLPKIRDRNPVLHLDPLSVVRHRLAPQDIVLCHDIGPVTHPAQFAPGVKELYVHAFALIERTGPHMVFVSRTSQDEFHAHYGTAFASSTVIYNPTRSGIGTGAERRPAGLRAPFLLTVGNIGDRKNQLRCVEAFARAGLAGQGWQYVLTGGPEPGFEAVAALAARTQGVVMPGYVDDEQLRWLYRNASGFVLMSLLEGFGMPVVEAASHGLMCLVSRGGILREIGGPAVMDADPLDPDAIARGMRQIAGMSEAERADRLARTRQHIRNFEPGPIMQQWRDLVDGIELRHG